MNEQQKMPFWKHIEELRTRIIRCFIIIIIFMIILMINKNFVFDKIIFGPAKINFITYRLLKKLIKILEIYNYSTNYYFNNLYIQNRKIFGQFNVYIWTCFIGGIILSFPYIFYEFWGFISPALSKKEKKYSIKIFFMVFVLFSIGIFFGYFILCPFLIHFAYYFKISYIPKNIFDLCDYISLITNSTLLMGIIFLFPFFMYLLTKMELISYEFLNKYKKHALLVMLIISSAITPGDIISTIIVLIPLLILYKVSLYISFHIQQKKPS
ncbi:twin-arginine translocase subunit TatC [Blattabacterium cuenoti]|uniref:twin-arginine translocase subunit TatC n=1 Tax=Blattabacterium cuenoti TaxID=1653831 RepID=UPI00163C5C69|nr:twin-arginine translocase subunit TatC [Blattabacterium cuenoti]